mmetsp:Transcript_19260/g.56153  ORF Transcript_19260/g.56153 Transcript_19260/m.56153 type:complete len:369 (-) Transcript_19260:1337-2443(-)
MGLNLEVCLVDGEDCHLGVTYGSSRGRVGHRYGQHDVVPRSRRLRIGSDVRAERPIVVDHGDVSTEPYRSRRFVIPRLGYGHLDGEGELRLTGDEEEGVHGASALDPRRGYGLLDAAARRRRDPAPVPGVDVAPRHQQSRVLERMDEGEDDVLAGAVFLPLVGTDRRRRAGEISERIRDPFLGRLAQDERRVGLDDDDAVRIDDSGAQDVPVGGGEFQNVAALDGRSSVGGSVAVRHHLSVALRIVVVVAPLLLLLLLVIVIVIVIVDPPLERHFHGRVHHFLPSGIRVRRADLDAEIESRQRILLLLRRRPIGDFHGQGPLRFDHGEFRDGFRHVFTRRSRPNGLYADVIPRLERRRRIVGGGGGER